MVPYRKLLDEQAGEPSAAMRERAEPGAVVQLCQVRGLRAWLLEAPDGTVVPAAEVWRRLEKALPVEGFFCVQRPSSRQKLTCSGSA